jgi:hypothetical protein
MFVIEFCSDPSSKSPDALLGISQIFTLIFSMLSIHLLIAKSRDLQQALYTLFAYMINPQHPHTHIEINIDESKESNDDVKP